MISRELKDTMYRRYLDGVAREAKKGKVNAPLTRSQWASEFEFIIEEEYGEKERYTNRELRKTNQAMIQSAKNQMTREQKAAWRQVLAENNWEEAILESGEDPEIIGDVRKILEDLGYSETMTETKRREWLNFYGKDFLDQLEALGLQDWSVFFNS